MTADGRKTLAQNRRHLFIQYILHSVNFVLLLICVYAFVLHQKADQRSYSELYNDICRNEHGSSQNNVEIARQKRLSYEPSVEFSLEGNDEAIRKSSVYSILDKNSKASSTDEGKTGGQLAGRFGFSDEISSIIDACLKLQNFCISDSSIFKSKVGQGEQYNEQKNKTHAVSDQPEKSHIVDASVSEVITIPDDFTSKNEGSFKSGKKVFEDTINPKNRRKRKRCFIDKLGLPVEIGYRKVFYGSWMRDARPKHDLDADKRFVMEHFSGTLLQEYADSEKLSHPESSPVKTYQLPYMYDGTSQFRDLKG